MSRPPAGGRRVDLHTHTNFSDGQLAPEALVRLALERGLAVLAITDHDTVEGLAPARAAAAGRLEVIPGIEISSAADGAEFHVLGYGVRVDDATLRERLERFRRERIERADAMVARLGQLGAGIDRDEVYARAGQGVVGRPHLADALVRAGHAFDIDDAFRRYLGADGAAYVPRPAFRPDEAIALIRAAGGVSVLAHPGATLADRVIEGLAARGLNGLEVWHPQHGTATMRRYLALAQRLQLLATGGSDFHGEGRGVGLGDMPVPWSAVEALQRALGRPRPALPHGD